MESDAGSRNGLTSGAVDLDHLHIGVEVGVVDQITIGFAVFADEHVKGFQKLAAFPALDLLDGVSAVGQILRLSKAVLVADQIIALGVFGVVIGACALEIDSELCAFLGGLDLRLAVVGVLDDGDIAFLDLFVLLHGFAVILSSIVLGIDADLLVAGGDEIALAAVQLLDRPVVTADIILGGELAARVSDIGVAQLVALVDSVLGACQIRIALSGARFDVLLGNSKIPFLEHVIEALVCHFVPLDSRCLIVGDNIADRSVYLFQRVTRANQNVAEGRNAAGVSHSILVHRNATVRGAIQVELQTFVEPVLCGLCYFEVAALQVVVKTLIGDFVPFNSCRLIVGDNIAVRSTNLLQGIAGSDQHIVKYRDTAGIGDSVFIHRQSAIGGAVQMELHALDEAILRSLRDLQISTAQGVIERDSRGLAADDGNSLRGLRFILIISLLSNGIDSGKQIQIDCTVLTGRNRLIDAIAGDIELNTLDYAVFAGFHDVANAIGLCVQFEVEEHRVFCAGGHRLLAGAAPNEHLAHAEVGLLLCRNHHSVGNHVLAGEGVLVSAAGDSNAAGREVDICQGVVGVGQGDAVVVIRLIILHGVGLCIALIARGEAWHDVVLGHLLQNPVVAFLSRAIFQGGIEQIGFNAICGCKACRTRSDLLLIFPDDALRRVDEIIHVRP